MRAGGAEAALRERTRPGGAPRPDSAAEAALGAPARTAAPGGRTPNGALQPWRRQARCIAALTPESACRMEDAPGRYAEPADPRRPVVCLDEGRYARREEARAGTEHRRAGARPGAAAFARHRAWGRDRPALHHRAGAGQTGGARPRKSLGSPTERGKPGGTDCMPNVTAVSRRPRLKPPGWPQ